MQAVILAGGLATRLRPLTETLPKCLVKVGGRPFLEYQLELLKKNGISRILLCLGHLSEMVTKYFQEGEKFGVSLSYSVEEERLLGTGGALRKAWLLLENEFLLLYGDSYLDFSYSEIIEHYQKKPPVALLSVYRNQNQWDRSNAVVEDGYVKIYDKNNFLPEMQYIDAGLSILSKNVIREIPPHEFYDLADLYKSLVRRKLLQAYQIRQRFYEVGSTAGLQEFTALIEQGGLT
jgi:NDP-sugar pyrophosphorylase family protein